MTKSLSPAAQAVLDAFLNGYICNPKFNVAFESDRNGLAAALVAAADQAEQKWPGFSHADAEACQEIRAIAAELMRAADSYSGELVRMDEGRVQRGNGNGAPATPKPDIIPNPQFPPPRKIREDFLP